MRLTDAEIYEKFADELVRFATGLVGPSDAADVAGALVGVGPAVGRKESVGG